MKTLIINFNNKELRLPFTSIKGVIAVSMEDAPTEEQLMEICKDTEAQAYYFNGEDEVLIDFNTVSILDVAFNVAFLEFNK